MKLPEAIAHCTALADWSEARAKNRFRSDDARAIRAVLAALAKKAKKRKAAKTENT